MKPYLERRQPASDAAEELEVLALASGGPIQGARERVELKILSRQVSCLRRTFMEKQANIGQFGASGLEIEVLKVLQILSYESHLSRLR